MFGVIKDGSGGYKFGPHQIAKIDRELDNDSTGKYIWRKEFSDTKISLVPLNRPYDYHFTMEVSSDGEIILSWKGINGESLPSVQEFRKCQLMLRAWRNKINEAINSNENSQKEASDNLAIFKGEETFQKQPIHTSTTKEQAEAYLRNLNSKSKDNYRRGYSHNKNSSDINLSKSESSNVLSYLSDKGFVNTKSGYGDSIIITTSGIDYLDELNEDKGTKQPENHMNDQSTLIDKFKKLDELARQYKNELNRGQQAKVNSHTYIDIFTKWFLEARNIFSKYFDKSNLSYSEFAGTKIDGNGFYQSSKFFTLEPTYQFLKSEILSELNKPIKMTTVSITNKFFVIHGHNDQIKLEVTRFIETETGKKAIILHEMPNKGKTIIEKFENYSDVDFAIGLWTADDIGSAKSEEEVKDRARQNVIFETGYFIGKLGRSKVIVLHDKDIEIPSDYSGVIYIPLSGNWKYNLEKEIDAIYNDLSIE